jgi:hypothetical protein
VYEDANLAGQDLHGTPRSWVTSAPSSWTRIIADEHATEWAQADPTACWFDSTPYTTPVIARQGAAILSPGQPHRVHRLRADVHPGQPDQGGAKPPYTDTLDLNPQGLTALLNSYGQDGPKRSSSRAIRSSTFIRRSGRAGENNNVVAPNLMQAALSQVTAILGHGNVNALPPNTRDWRFYFQYWAQAFTGYLLNRR